MSQFPNPRTQCTGHATDLHSHLPNPLPTLPLSLSLIALNLTDDNGNHVASYQIVKEFLCARSEYFNSYFTSGFQESDQDTVEMQGTPQWIVEVFIKFVYTGKLSLEGIQVGPTVRDVNEPATWSWEVLFEIYAFADYIDTRTLRNSILEASQIKTCALHEFPTGPEYSILCALIPSGTQLYKFLCEGDDIVIRNTANVPAQFQNDHNAYIARRNNARMCLHCGPMGDGARCFSGAHRVEDAMAWTSRSWCLYHEHGRNREEMLMCEWRREALYGRLN